MFASSFVGRIEDLDDVIRLVSSEPVVTIVGPGGVGKTRLAQRVVAEMTDEFVDGVHSVNLANLRQRESVATAAASALGFRSLESLTASLADASALLFVDNCEHVVVEVASFITHLRDACSALAILTTSRTPLQVRGERVRPLLPLRQEDACELLRQRAQGAGANLRVPAAALAPLADRVDNLPLGIELAAIRLRALDPGEVIQALDQSLDVLQLSRGPNKNRHDSLSTTIAWSYELLEADEADGLRWLTVLPSPFDINRAHAVLSPLTRSRIETADLLDRLVSKSMLSPRDHQGNLGYRLLETIRQFAIEQMNDVDERTAVVGRYLDFVEAQSTDLVQRAAQRWSQEIVDQTHLLAPDLRVALRLCIEVDESGERAFSIFLPAWGLVHEWYAGEFAEIGDALLAQWPSDTPGWGDVAAITATAHVRLSQRAEADRFANAALKAGGFITEPVGHRVLGMLAQHQGEFESALGHVRSGLEEAERLDLEPFAAELEVFEATLLGQLGQVDQAIEVAHRAQHRNRGLGSAPVATWSLVLEAYVLSDRDPTRAAELAAIAEGEVRFDDPQFIVARHLGVLSAKRGDNPRAARWLRRALAEAKRAGEIPQYWATLQWIGVLGATSGTAIDEAASLLFETASSPETPAAGAFEEPLLTEALTVCARKPLVRSTAPLGDLAATVLRQLEEQPAPEAVHGKHLETEPGGQGALTGTFLRNGEMWRVGLDTEQCELAHSKGLADLAALLARPGEEMHVLDLMGAGAQQTAIDDSIDTTAKTHYEQRIRELQAELEEAEDANDQGRINVAQQEFDHLVDALAGAYGLRGRPRTTGASAEKARSAVRWRIQAAIKKMQPHAPLLARHLKASVKTGVWCSYDPEKTVVWTIS